MSTYALAAVIGRTLPDGVLWGHTLNQWIGVNGGMYPAYACYALALVLVVRGWCDIYKHYWSKGEGRGQLVTKEIYGVIRHPQYTGSLLATLGMLFEWATLPLLTMWPMLVWLYVRLARREEADMEAEFGEAYRAYKRRTGGYVPAALGARARDAAAGPGGAPRLRPQPRMARAVSRSSAEAGG